MQLPDILFRNQYHQPRHTFSGHEKSEGPEIILDAPHGNGGPDGDPVEAVADIFFQYLVVLNISLGFRINTVVNNFEILHHRFGRNNRSNGLLDGLSEGIVDSVITSQCHVIIDDNPGAIRFDNF